MKKVSSLALLMGIESCSTFQDIIVRSQYRYFCDNQILSTADQYRSQVFLSKCTIWDTRYCQLPAQSLCRNFHLKFSISTSNYTVNTHNMKSILCGLWSICWKILLRQWLVRWDLWLFKMSISHILCCYYSSSKDKWYRAWQSKMIACDRNIQHDNGLRYYWISGIMEPLQLDGQCLLDRKAYLLLSPIKQE